MAKLRFPIHVALIALALALAACNRQARVVGTWKASVVDKSESDTMAGDFMQRLLGMTLEFRKDGTCYFTVLVKIPGTYEVSGSRVIVNLQSDSKGNDGSSMSGIHPDKPFTLDLSSDGMTLTAENSDTSSRGDLIFQKQP